MASTSRPASTSSRPGPGSTSRATPAISSTPPSAPAPTFLATPAVGAGARVLTPMGYPFATFVQPEGLDSRLRARRPTGHLLASLVERWFVQETTGHAIGAVLVAMAPGLAVHVIS